MIQVMISISTTAESPEAAQAMVDGIAGLPEGAMLTSTMSQPLTTGVVDDTGTVVVIAPPEGPA